MRYALAALAAATMLVGCSTVYQDPTEEMKMQPQLKAYPAGPYGYTIGTRIANLTLSAKSDDNGSGVIDSADTIKSVELADIFADKSIKALYVGVSAEWCPPCNAEQPDLVKLYNSYQSAGKGVAFLEAMNQDVKGNPADFTVVNRWSTKYKIPFMMAADPNESLGPYYAIAAFPMEMVIDTTDMTITYQFNGEDVPDLQAAIDDVLAQHP
jgi:thiol-disulfide isomerase/thioredoxin